MSLKLENVSVVYGEGTPFRKVALDNINIEFPKGKITGIITAQVLKQEKTTPITSTTIKIKYL